MKLSVKGLAKAGALLWGGCAFLTGTANLIWPAYAKACLEVLASIYPGYSPAGFGSIILLTIYALIDGAVGGVLLAWLYNLMTP